MEYVHYGNSTVITIDYQAPETSVIGYSNSEGGFVLPGLGSVNTNSIVENDDYHNLKYTMTISGNYGSNLKSGTYEVNNDYLNSVTLDVSTSNTTITFDQKRILAYNFTSSDGALIIKPILPKEKYNKIIVLDAGHGGTDPGASGQGLVEKDLNLNILLKAKQMFDNDGSIKCYVTRDSDFYPSFDDRTGLANEVGDAFVSIHINSVESSTPQGTETFSLYPNDLGNGLTSYELAETILNNLIENLGTVNRNVKTNNLKVLRDSVVPSTLIEVGFITNPGDAAIMGSDSGQEAAAKAVFEGVKTLFNKYTPVR